MFLCSTNFLVFFFNDTATTEIYTLSLHDALPISVQLERLLGREVPHELLAVAEDEGDAPFELGSPRSEEHTSELQSQSNLVCRLLLEKKKKRLSGFVLALLDVVQRPRLRAYEYQA